MTVGILALQGDFAMHQRLLNNLGHSTRLVRYPDDLTECDRLIIPGGESTNLSLQLDSSGLRSPLLEFARSHSIFGTCAGLIMLATAVGHPKVSPLGLMPMTVDRNGWGRQVNSFIAEIDLEFSKDQPFKGTFIRAPKISKHNPDLRILGRYQTEPVLITDNHHLAAAFHPELEHDSRIHEFFLSL